MIEPQNEDHTLGGFDPRLVRRVFSFARPYRSLIVTALIALVVATVADVMIPVIIQRTVDHHIIDEWVAIDGRARGEIPNEAEHIAIRDWIFYRTDTMDAIPRARRERWQTDGTMSSGEYLLVPRNALNELDSPIAANLLGDSFASSEEWVALEPTSLTDLDPDDRIALRRDNVGGLRRNVILFLGILTIALAASFGQVYLTAFAGQLVMKDLRLRLFRHTIDQSLGYLSSQPVGKLVTRVTNDVETINELFTSVLAELIRNISLMIAVVVTMISLNPRLGLIVIGTMLPVVGFTELFRRQARSAYRTARKAVSRVNAYLSEYIPGMAVVQLFGQTQRSKAEFAERNDELLGAQLTEMRIFAIFRPIVDFLSSTSTAILLYVGARSLEMNLVSLGVLIAFANLIRRFYMPVMSISEQFTVLQSALAGAERVFELLDQSHEIPDHGESILDRSSFQGRIAFEHVRFAYKQAEPVLHDVSFEVEPGQTVAIVGYTGAGKTTVINLLTRLWDIDAGAIRIDGTEIRDLPLTALRSLVQQIQQDVHLFDGTLRENIALGEPFTEDQLEEACRAVQLGDLLKDHEEGLDLRIQERGANLSAGQRQLISFARALVHDPPILVLDEATSSIDSETEARLQAAVGAVTRGRTSIVIAHRLSTILDANQILVMSRGHLVEAGTHTELLERDGLYASLYRLQFARHGSSHA